jgi:hypothetical protein
MSMTARQGSSGQMKLRRTEWLMLLTVCAWTATADARAVCDVRSHDAKGDGKTKVRQRFRRQLTDALGMAAVLFC